MRLPKVDDEVRIDWIDSGLMLSSTHIDPKNLQLCSCATFGRVVYVEKKGLFARVVLATTDDATPDTEGVGRDKDLIVIWIPSITDVKIFQ